MPVSTARNPFEPLTQQFTLHSYEVDFNRGASLQSVCRFFLEAAWNHAEVLGVGYHHLAEQQRLWVLSRLLITVKRCPQWNETVTVRTWPRQARGPFALRDFQMLDSAGVLLISGSSSWLILDARTRRPQRVDRLLHFIAPPAEQRATERDAGKLPEVANPEPGWFFEPRYTDVDINGHVNSCRYVGLLLNCYPLEFHQVHQPEELEINYLGETHAGDVLEMKRWQDGALQFWHTVSRQAAQVCRARIQWRVS